jgi:hypothetical protein
MPDSAALFAPQLLKVIKATVTGIVTTIPRCLRAEIQRLELLCSK